MAYRPCLTSTSQLLRTMLAACLLLLHCESADTATLKPIPRGLIYLGPLGFLDADNTPATFNFPQMLAPYPVGIMSAVVLNVAWFQLEPTPGGYNFTFIEDFLAALDQYNSARPAGVPATVAKLRVMAAAAAPDWVKTFNGTVAPLNISITVGSKTTIIHIPYFWNTTVRGDWQRLQTTLAAAYDSDPRIASVTDTSCMSHTGEPLIIQAGPYNVPNLLAAGYTDEAYITCLYESWMDYSAWKQSPIDRAFNPFRTIQGGTKSNYTFAPDLMVYWVGVLGSQAILAQRSLACAPPENNNTLLLEQYMGTLGYPIHYQTCSPYVNWSVIAEALLYNGTALEVWSTTGGTPGFNAYDAATLYAWDNELGYYPNGQNSTDSTTASSATTSSASEERPLFSEFATLLRLWYNE